MSDRNKKRTGSSRKLPRPPRNGHPRHDTVIPGQRSPLVLITCNFPQQTVDRVNALVDADEFVHFSEVLRHAVKLYLDDRDFIRLELQKKQEENNHEGHK